MKKPVIGVMPLVDTEKDSYWMLPGYMNGIRQAGGIPIMLPLSDDKNELLQILKMCDGLLFTGGQDVAPSMYNELPINDSVVPCEERDNMESIVLKLAMKMDIPILAICRGIQFINAYLGGSLYQDIPTQYSTNIIHQMSKPYDRTAHNVSIVKDSPLYSLLQTELLGVNSYHHQAVKELTTMAMPMAFSEDGLCEAFYVPNKKFIWALQWHPELSYETDENSMAIFRHFVNVCS